MSLTKVNKNERKRLKTDIPFYTDTKSIESSLLHKKMCIETQPNNWQTEDKQKILQILLERNKKLKNSIYEIQDLEQRMIEAQQKNKQQNRRKSLTGIVSDASTLRKQLDGVYQKINMYEKQIAQFKNQQDKSSCATITSKIEKLNNKFYEQQTIKERAKSQMIKIKKEIKNQGKEIQRAKGALKDNKYTNLVKEIEHYRQRVKEFQKSQENKEKMMKKQEQFIKKLHVAIIEEGGTKESIKNIFSRVSEQFKSIEAQKSSSLSKRKSPQGPNSDQIKILKTQTDAIKTDDPLTYKQMKHQLKVLKKAIKDQQKKIEQEEEEYYLNKNLNTQRKMKLSDLQKEIKSIEKQIGETRKRIGNKLPKPKFYQPNTHPQEQNKKVSMAELRKKYTFKKTATIESITSQDIGFSDAQRKLSIGSNFAKITGIIVFYSSTGVCGVQAIYAYNFEGQLHIKKQQNMSQQKFMCVKGEYISNMVCQIFLQKNIIVSVTVMTNHFRYSTLGLNIKQKGLIASEIAQDPLKIPVCLHGTFGDEGINKIWAEVMDIEDFEKQREEQQKGLEGSYY